MPRITDYDRFAFIVGAPRCGTTTISRMLRRPDVSFSLIKEPHFFSEHDLRGLSDGNLRKRVEEDYLTRFFAPADGARIGAEGSVSYLYTPEQMEPVLKVWPDSRFVICVRDPITMLPSLHQRLIYIGDETLTRFEDAWAATPDRAAGRRIPKSCLDSRWLRYDEAGRLATYVERLFATVGRERCLVVVFDDLVADARREFARILDFIGIDASEPIDVPVARDSRRPRYVWLHRLLKRPPRALHHVASRHYRLRLNGEDDDSSRAMDKVLSVRKRLLRWNRVQAPTDPVPVHVQDEIRLYLQDEVDRLGSLIGRDLSHWLQPREGTSSDASP